MWLIDFYLRYIEEQKFDFELSRVYVKEGVRRARDIENLSFMQKLYPTLSEIIRNSMEIAQR